MLEAKDITFSYSKKSELVLNDLSFSLPTGKIGIILGPNGAGKSTLLKCLDGIIAPQKGDVLLEGQNAKEIKKNEMAKRISYVAQNPELGPLNVFETVKLGRLPYAYTTKSRDDKKKTLEAIEMMGLTTLISKNVNDLSGGERQKVAIARALAQEGDILLLDEPTSNLDIKNQEILMSLIKHLKETLGLTVLLSMHDINLALRYGEVFYLFISGKIAYYGDETIVNEETISEVYGIKAVSHTIDGGKFMILGGHDNEKK